MKKYLDVVVKEIIKHKALNSRTFVLSSTDKETLPSFKAGQYISVRLKIGDSYVSRPYSLCSSPKDAQEGKYEITVQSNPNGFAADWMIDNIKRGSRLTISEPQGNFYYRGIRRNKTIVAIAGGSGITPFLAMARAIKDGIENYKLIILFGNKTEEDILFKRELDEICKVTGKVQVVYVFGEDKVDSDLVRKYAKGNYSVYACGPGSMYDFLRTELKKLNKAKRFIRFEMQAVPKNPTEVCSKTVAITVKQGSKEYEIKADSKEPILVALERASIKAPSCCRSGICGWCKSYVVSGNFFVPKINDKRSKADIRNSIIHPCATFAMSDMVIEVSDEQQF